MSVRVLIVSIAGREEKRRVTLHRTLVHLSMQTIPVEVLVIVSGCSSSLCEWRRRNVNQFPNVEYLWSDEALSQSEGWKLAAQTVPWNDNDIILLHDDDDTSHMDRCRIQRDVILEEGLITAVPVWRPSKPPPRVARADYCAIPNDTDTATLGMTMCSFRRLMHNCGSSKHRYQDVKLWRNIKKAGFKLIGHTPLYYVRSSPQDKQDKQIESPKTMKHCL